MKLSLKEERVVNCDYGYIPDDQWFQLCVDGKPTSFFAIFHGREEKSWTKRYEKFKSHLEKEVSRLENEINGAQAPA
jgi:hypothetical protein